MGRGVFLLCIRLHCMEGLGDIVFFLVGDGLVVHRWG
jgi:hypothetical protein